MNTLVQRLNLGAQRALNLLEALQPAALLVARIHVAVVFFRSGLTKITD